MTKIMYVCDLCRENAPECCGHDDRDELRVVPESSDYSETTLCRACWVNWTDWREDERPEWDTLPMPPKFGPVTANAVRDDAEESLAP